MGHNNNELAKARRRRGRPEEPPKVEIEFINDDTASERWNRIFELLEAEYNRIPLIAATEPEQLSLF